MAISAWWILGLAPLWRDLPEYQHGWLVVLLAGYLVWERIEGRGEDASTRPDRPRPGWAWTWFLPGFFLILVSEAYRYVFAITPAYSFGLSVGSAFLLTAVLTAGYGPRTARRYLFPILFFFVAVPLPKIIWNPIVLGLQSLVASVNVEALGLAGIPATKQGSLIRLPECVVGVDEACSGIRSLQSSLMAALFIGDITMRTKGAKSTLIAFGVGLAILGNLIRSFYLSYTAHHHGPQALEAVHDTAGWGILAFTAAGVAAAAWTWSRLEGYSLTLQPQSPRTEKAMTEDG